MTSCAVCGNILRDPPRDVREMPADWTHRQRIAVRLETMLALKRHPAASAKAINDLVTEHGDIIVRALKGERP